jgi:glycerophosphoryl diester phosphodiesterase
MTLTRPPVQLQVVDRSTPWPYPFWVAHRGAGKLAPENTLAAFRLGASFGWRMFECDAKLSADHVVFLLHDATLERTSSGVGLGGDLTWEQLRQLDAGSWHSPAFAGEPLATLEGVARFCLSQGLELNIEIKPTPGLEERTGERVAQEAWRLWTQPAVNGAPNPARPLPPFLTSFRPEALMGAMKAVPQLPRGLLMHEWWDGWLPVAERLQAVAIVANHQIWTESTLAAVKRAGMRALTYTVNEEARAEQLTAMGLDGIITDAVDAFGPARRPPAR